MSVYPHVQCHAPSAWLRAATTALVVLAGLGLGGELSAQEQPAAKASDAKDCPPWICKGGAAGGIGAATGQPGAKPSQPGAKPPNAGKSPAGAAPAATAPAATATKGASVADKKPAKEKSYRFIEGELANVGATGLTPWQNRFGVVAGFDRIGDIYYAMVRPEINYTREVYERDLTMSFAVPLRLEVFDTRPEGKWNNAGTFREKDWDEVSDYSQVLRYINYGGKEEHFYLDINQFKASSIGHGLNVRRYNPNLNVNTRRVSAQLDAFTDYIGFETYINDITGPNVLGTLVFLKPLSFINRKNYFLRSFSVGATFAADTNAPLRNRLDSEDLDKDGRRENEIQIDQDTFQPVYEKSAVIAYGGDLEFKLVDTRQVDWKMYFDYSFLETGVPTDCDPNGTSDEDQARCHVDNLTWRDIPTQAIRSSGLTWGNLLRLNLSQDPVHALRIRFELRRYDHNYLPSYFDTLYEIQRMQYFAGLNTAKLSSSQLANATKLQAVLGRDPNGPTVNGLYFEASWKVSHYIALAVAMEVNDQTPDNNMFVHLETPHLGNWQFLATYHHRNVDTVAELFNLSLGDSDVFIMKARWGLGDALHVNMEAITPFGLNSNGLFANTVTFNINAEIGFSYGSRK